eukprot:TRINITY_DN12299_c0_g1_i2.p1 TRINITY_DN12299_c0_g1~~TRINITY_DN12299_c0_g1_i2.p1  ORF type:complete len:172 (+),score=22.15 TRINITY_DN12299_c0_g1_i2:191-706(+)
MTPNDRAVLASNEKSLGNTCFKRGNYQDALSHYSMAIQYDPYQHVYYTNRALVYLKLCRYQEAITDCTISIDRQPSIKAFHHRASARAEIGHHQLSVDDFKRALLFENNLECRESLLRSLEILKADFEKSYEKNGESHLPSDVRQRLKSVIATLNYFEIRPNERKVSQKER